MINSIGLIFVIVNLAFVQVLTQNKEIKQLSDKVLLQKLRQTAREINATMPVVIESGLMCDNVSALPERKFQYNFTITNLLKADADTTLIRSFIRHNKPVLTKAVRSDSTLIFFRQQKVTLIYIYRDKHGDYLYNITVKPEDYQDSLQ